MKILFVANCGFGDVSWETSWPRFFSERGHELDIFLMKYTGNPFHANPFIKNLFIVNNLQAYKQIREIIERNSYDAVLIPNNNCGGVAEVIEVTKDLKNVYNSKPWKVPGLDLPELTKPEWYFTKEELRYIEDKNLGNSILFNPLCSGVTEKSRNINFDLIIECSKKLDNIVVLYGGFKFLPIDGLKRMEAAGIRLLWENYNCFNDEYGTTLGKFLAITSLCKASIHAWSGSFTFSMGFNKPYIMVVPGDSIRANSGSPYIDTKILYEQGIGRAKAYGCLDPSAWCITEKADIIIEAVNYVLAGKTGSFNKMWSFI